MNKAGVPTHAAADHEGRRLGARPGWGFVGGGSVAALPADADAKDGPQDAFKQKNEADTIEDLYGKCCGGVRQGRTGRPGNHRTARGSDGGISTLAEVTGDRDPGAG